MKDSLERDQQYQLYKHEFEDVDPKVSTSYSFKLDLVEGKVTNVKKVSKMAEDFLIMVHSSPTGKELMSQNDFKIDLSSDFMIKVKSEAREMPEEEIPATEEEEKNEEAND